MRKLGSISPQSLELLGGQDVQPDRVGAEFVGGAPQELIDSLAAIVGYDNVHGRLSDLVAWATEAGPYRVMPQVAVSPRTDREVAQVISYARENGRHVTFRAAGTALSGQTGCDDILIDLKTHFGGMKVLDGGARIWTKPGMILGDAQAILARDGFMLGPDPGSTAVCTIGGVLANNAGGMRCSLDRDSYHSIEDMTVALASGTLVDTAAGDAAFRSQEPKLHEQMVEFRDRLRANTAVVDFLREKFSIRNTNGLRLDAFLDYDQPVDILKHLMIGSEGILGAITEATIRTVALPRVKATVWVMLPDIREAAKFVAPMMDAGAIACELLVAPVMRTSVANFPEAPREWADIDDKAAALLVEVGGGDLEELEAAQDRIRAVLADAPLTAPLTFDSTVEGMRGAWKIRSGLFGLLGADRPQGATYITEDVCFPPAKIGEAASDLMDLQAKYGAPESVMGHAAFGNLHFFLLPQLNSEKDRQDYANFLDDLAELVIDKYHGSMKAEHGTGTNMAPYVLREWGEEVYELFWEVKDMLDPNGVLAPNIKLSREPDIHLKNFKSHPKIEEEINLCVECGFCENVCPSRHATVTPRQRIVLRREMARQPEGSEVLRKLQEEYVYDAVDMCAADGSCSIPCPLSIDTGAVMKQMRAQGTTPRSNKVALTTAQKWAAVEKLARAGVISANKVGHKPFELGANLARNVVSPDLLPTVPGPLPQAASRLPKTSREGATALYFPACINRIFGKPAGASADSVELPQAVVELGRRSGRPVWIPEDVTGDCCGTPWSSKGYKEGFEHQARTIVRDLWHWSEHGALPIIVDAASCTHGLLDNVPHALSPADFELWEQLKIVDVVEWLRDEVVDYLPIVDTAGRIAVHPTCSTEHMGISADLLSLAKLCGEASIPEGATCCGTAGDRGLLHPELVASATREEMASVHSGDFDCFVSDNRTCEMGLEMESGKAYESIAVLLERVSRPVISP